METPDAPVPLVLVVEDERLVREIITQELEDAGYRVLQAETGEGGLEALRGEPGVRLLFTDIRLPGPVDGWRLAEEARRLRPGLPVIYATGYSEESPRQVAGSIFLTKPYRPSGVIRAAASLGVPPAA
jgi:CheY-like chemotaxis protein